METVNDVLEHCKWLVSKGRGGEAGKLFMPRVEAQKRRANKEGHKRVVWVTDEITYGELHAAKDHWVTNSHNNPAIALPNMAKVLLGVSAETIQAMSEDRDEQQDDAENPSLAEA